VAGSSQQFQLSLFPTKNERFFQHVEMKRDLCT